MNRITRRELLTAAVAAAAVSACSDDSTASSSGTLPTSTSGAERSGPLKGIDASSPPAIPSYEPVAAFPEGIISGSPLSDAIVLWTRVDPAKVGATEADSIDVTVELATDPSFANVLDSRTGTAGADTDHTVHLDVDGLAPSSWYFYRFVAGTGTARVISPVGRTRTAPGDDETVDASRIAFFSCQRYTHGWFTSHRHLAAQRDVDLVISLGDYVYQDSKADNIVVDGRLDPTEPAHDLTTFRAKYAWYRSDPDLQAMHAAAPFVCIPDNHDGRDGPWEDTEFVDGAIGAFFERMPVRRSTEEPGRIYGDVAWGDLFHLFLLDVRQYRSRPTSDGTVDTATDQRVWDPELTTLGAEQKTWLKDGLVATKATWKLIGSQLMFSPTRIADLDNAATRASDPGRTRNAGIYINGTQWDGFQAERDEIVSHLHDRGVENTIVLSGDMHWFAAGDGQVDTDDPASPYVYSEFVGGSVTSAAGERFSSNGGLVTPGILPVVRAANRQLIRFFDVDRHGYGALNISKATTTVDFVSPVSIKEPNADVEVLASFEIPAGGTGMKVTKGAQF